MELPRRLRPEDLPDLAESLAQAFRDNPLNRAVIRGGERRRLRSNRAGMRATLVSARPLCSIWGIDAWDAALVGGLIAIPPDAWPLPPPPILEQLRVLIRQGPGTAKRWGEVFEALHAVHPPESCWVLALVGVGPDAQGRGFGRALMRRWIDEVDEHGEAAYLETDRPELVPFYAGFGFQTIHSFDLFGVPVRCLWRPGRIPGARRSAH
jgi:GNAT superfamily N-acetyltransferase